jgi:YidC/Oxa1 family membrane protein insertase
MQQKVMKFMMVFMGFLFYRVPSGLCLYFIASSIWGIAERKLVPPATPPTAATAVPARPVKPDTGRSGGKANGRQKRRR